MAMFPKTGTNERASLPGHKAIEDGTGPRAYELPKFLSGILDAADKYVGWVPPFNEPIKKPKLEKPPEEGKKAGAYSKADGIGPGIVSYERAYTNMVEDLRRHGYKLVELPEGEMVSRFGDPDGYETGNVVYINRDRDARKKTKIGFHEAGSKLARARTGLGHYDVHGVIGQNEEAALGAYAMGETDVIKSFAERAMRDLRMAA